MGIIHTLIFSEYFFLGIVFHKYKWEPWGLTKLNDITGLGSYIGIFCGKPLHIEAYLRAGPDEINDVACT